MAGQEHSASLQTHRVALQLVRVVLAVLHHVAPLVRGNADPVRTRELILLTSTGTVDLNCFDLLTCPIGLVEQTGGCVKMARKCFKIENPKSASLLVLYKYT